jgi:hypothetical protein
MLAWSSVGWSNVHDKLSHDDMLWPHLSKPQSDSTLHSEWCTSTKETLTCVSEKYVNVCNMSHSCQNKPNSFCYVCGEVVLKSQKKPHCQNFWEKLTNCIMNERSEIKIKSGCQRHAAAHVQGLWQVGWKVPTNLCLLLFRWCGVSLETT